MIDAGGQLGLLLVHRDDAVLRQLETAAQQSGFFYSAIKMTDGRFALEHVWQCIRGERKNAVPDAVVAGVRLGGLNGVQFTRELRRYDETRGLFIALLPAMAGPLDQDAAENAGCDFFLRRPESTAGLAKAFASIAQRCRARASPEWTCTARLWHASFSGSGLDVSDAELRGGGAPPKPTAPRIIELGEQREIRPSER
jgi:CheY-like chemotaxis protein